ncbi:hypothetical protein NDU88_000486 [Pleurodeles waltl]|uniref:Uncharacterized protein n=1 Tax=Pleurodeles waltl TaxID=8319 RepID=A0AAV7P109_PLEWA|nr:hypothetical protein NDU88_000486 [Pleurodeles waltl]
MCLCSPCETRFLQSCQVAPPPLLPVKGRLPLHRSAMSLMFVVNIPRFRFNAPLYRCAPPENHPLGGHVGAGRTAVPLSNVEVLVAGAPKLGLQMLPQEPPTPQQRRKKAV